MVPGRAWLLLGLFLLGFSTINLFQVHRNLREVDVDLANNFTFNSGFTNTTDLTVREHGKESTTEYPLNLSMAKTGGEPLSLCRREDIIHGSWVAIQKKKPPYISKTEHLRCYPLEVYQKSPWFTYEWKPHSTHCQFSDWDVSAFCSLMELGTVLISGDSLSWEQFSSLGQLLGLRVHQSSQFASRNNNQNHIQYGCRKRTRLVFRRDDVLSKLGSTISSSFPQVIVLNRGAHYQNDTAVMAGIQRNIRELQAWKRKCNDIGLKCHLFWRTSVPGHPLCDQVKFSEPNNDLVAMEAWISNHSNYNNRTMKYHWYDYQHQNNLILESLRQGLGEGGFEVLDAYYLNILRPDEHRAHQGDCLHNCYPGKMDVLNQLLLHYIRVQRTTEDVEYLQRLNTQASLLTSSEPVNSTPQVLQ